MAVTCASSNGIAFNPGKFQEFRVRGLFAQARPAASRFPVKGKGKKGGFATWLSVFP
jgi:hypothetical protein